MTSDQTGTLPLQIAANHPAFAGHFPGAPIVPGVVLLDAALYAIGEAIGADLSCCPISSVKFLSPVSQGEPVSVTYAVTYGMTADPGANGSLRFDLTSQARKVATGVLRLPLTA